MKVCSALGLSLLCGIVTAGCSMNLGNTPPPVVEAPPPPVNYGAFLDGPVASKLAGPDRDKALTAELGALESGQRRTWKGERGVYGYVELAPGAPAPALVDATAPPASGAAPSCRAFTSTIYIGGRPQVGHGTGCQNPDGTYRIAT